MSQLCRRGTKVWDPVTLRVIRQHSEHVCMRVYSISLNNACVFVCERACVCVRSDVRACVRACVRECLDVCMCARQQACAFATAQLHPNLYAYEHRSTPGYETHCIDRSYMQRRCHINLATTATTTKQHQQQQQQCSLRVPGHVSIQDNLRLTLEPTRCVMTPVQLTV